MGKIYNKATWKKLVNIKADIVDCCNKCAATGYVSDKTGIIECQCMSVFKYLSRLVLSDIPIEYWSLSLKTLQVKNHYKKMVRFFLDHYDTAIKRSLGILFMGTNGVGKTAMMCEIGKYFIAHHYSVLYFIEEQFINSLRPGGIPIDWQSFDVLLIDELGKSYIKEDSTFVVDKIEPFLRTAVGSKVVVSSTNFNLDGLSEALGDSTVSVLQRHLKTAPVTGEDFSNRRQADWKQLLETGYNYYHENILSMATIYSEGKSAK